MAQFARPNADTTTGSWTANGGPSALWDCLNESSPSDSDYIEGGTSATECRIELDSGISDPGVGTGHVMRVRWQEVGGSGSPERVTCTLYEGTTLRATGWSNYSVPSSWETVTYTLSEAEANSISDYTALNVRFTPSVAGGEVIQVSWFEFETPNVTTVNQPNWRFRSDDTQTINADAGWKANLNTNVTQDTGKLFRWRVELEESGGGSTTITPQLEARRKPSGGAYGSWENVLRWDSGSAASFVQLWASAQYSDGAATTNVLSGSSQAFTAGTGEWDGLGAAVTLSSQHTELEFTLLINKIFRSSGTITFASDNDEIELRITDNGTPLNGTVSSPQITVNIADNNLGGCSPETTGDWLLSDGTALYGFIEDSEVGATVLAMKSTDSGVTWTEQNGASRPTGTDAEGLDAVFDGSDTIWIGHFTGADTNVLHKFRTASHATNPDTWELTDESIGGTGLASAPFQCIAIAPRSDGTCVAFYNGNSGGNKVYYKIRSSGGTWGGENDLDSTASTAFQGVQCVVGENDLIHIFYGDSTNSHLLHKTLNSSDSLSSSDTTASGVMDFSPARTNEWKKPTYYDDGGVEVITVIYRNSSTSRLVSVQYRDNVIQSPQNVFGADVAVDGGGGGQPQASISSTGVDVWAVVAPAADKDLDITNSSDGGTWASLTSLVTGINTIYVQTEIWTNGSGDTILGVLYDDDEQLESGNFGGFTGRIFYTSYTIAVGTTTIATTSATLASSTEAATVAPGTTTIATTSATLASSTQAATISVPVKVTTTSATLASSTEAATVAPTGTATVTTTSATLASSTEAATVAPTGTATVTTTSATLASSTEAATVAPGTTTIATTSATLASSTQAATVAPTGTATVTTTSATLASSTQAATVAPTGTATVTTTSATLASSTQAATVSTTTVVTIATTSATLASSGGTVRVGGDSTIVLDTTSQNTSTASRNSGSFSHTCTGSDLTLVAFFMMFDANGTDVRATATYNGVSLTSVAVNAASWPGSRGGITQILILDNPATGANTFAFNYSESISADAVVVASFTGANNGAVEFGAGTGGTSGNVIEISGTAPGDDDMVMACGLVRGGDGDPWTPSYNETELADGETGSDANTDIAFTAVYLPATGSTQTLTTTASTTDAYSGVAIALAKAVVTITTTSATLASSTQAATVAPTGTATVTTTSATLASSGPASAVVPGITTIATGSATLASSGPAATVAPGTTTIATTSATLASSGPAATVAPGTTTIVTGSATLASSGPASAVVPGTTTIVTGSATLASSGPAVLVSIAPVIGGAVVAWVESVRIVSPYLEEINERGVSLIEVVTSVSGRLNTVE